MKLSLKQILNESDQTHDGKFKIQELDKFVYLFHRLDEEDLLQVHKWLITLKDFATEKHLSEVDPQEVPSEEKVDYRYFNQELDYYKTHSDSKTKQDIENLSKKIDALSKTT